MFVTFSHSEIETGSDYHLRGSDTCMNMFATFWYNHLFATVMVHRVFSNVSPLKSANQIIYLENIISSAESDINIYISMTHRSYDQMKILFFWYYKTVYFPSYCHISATAPLHYSVSKEMPGEKGRLQLHKNASCSFKQILYVTPCKTAFVRPLTSHL